ncbi:hypothetical protein HWV62_37209 [Athelia sp. TMB]|nr:hypothetical protein HWV62_37209 [Athelia sp. TMB]
MPLKYMRAKVKKVTPDKALQLAIATTAVAQELADMSSFPPARALVNIIMLIFQTVQQVQTNKDGCHRLARRAHRILVDINDQMAGRWETAPELLLKNLKKLEGSLQTIYDFMKSEVEHKWSSRFLRQGTVVDALLEYNALLDDASQSFQIATLINIHHIVGSRADSRDLQKRIKVREGSEELPPYKEDDKVMQITEKPRSSSPVRADGDIPATLITSSTSSLIEISTKPASGMLPAVDVLDDQYLTEELASLTLDDSYGFRRYHQSEVTLQGRSRLKEGWWAGAVEGQAGGQHALVKRYEGEKGQAAKRSKVFFGSAVQTRSPQALVLETARSSSLAVCADLMLRFDTALYVQRQFSLSDERVQDFVEKTTFRVGAYNALVLGLPPPISKNTHSFRNYNLSYTLLRGCVSMLPNRGYLCDNSDKNITPDMRKKINHLVTLAQGILPSERDLPTLSAHLQELIDCDPEDSQLTLRQVRELAFNASTHGHSWKERTAPAGKFALGDLGYIPAGKEMEDFVLIRNVVKDGLVQFQVESSPYGDNWCWKDFPHNRQRIDSYPLPGDVLGWAVAVPSGKQIDVAVHHEISIAPVVDAWKYLLENGESLAQDAGVKPEELILVTCTGTNQDFYIRHNDLFGGHLPALQPPQFGFNRAQPFGQQPPGMHGLNQRGMHVAHHQFHRPALPSIFYLFTSMHLEHEPYWSQTPVCVSKGAAIPPIPREYTYHIGW